ASKTPPGIPADFSTKNQGCSAGSVIGTLTAQSRVPFTKTKKARESSLPGPVQRRWSSVRVSAGEGHERGAGERMGGNPPLPTAAGFHDHVYHIGDYRIVSPKQSRGKPIFFAVFQTGPLYFEALRTGRPLLHFHDDGQHVANHVVPAIGV